MTAATRAIESEPPKPRRVWEPPRLTKVGTFGGVVMSTGPLSGDGGQARRPA
jgi:hypothetical protein